MSIIEGLYVLKNAGVCANIFTAGKGKRVKLPYGPAAVRRRKAFSCPKPQLRGQAIEAKRFEKVEKCAESKYPAS